jgi:hypothetical protein
MGVAADLTVQVMCQFGTITLPEALSIKFKSERLEVLECTVQTEERVKFHISSRRTGR